MEIALCFVSYRMLTYDPESTLVLLHDSCSALLVDASLCIDLEVMHSVFDSSSDRSKNLNVDHSWTLQRKSYVWVVGYLERADVSFSSNSPRLTTLFFVPV
ncbi:hypothetical protein PISMIDRAFT_687050 [Pisolithus microcarpus 441]|uniref:Uncharacterized protein n=1 Tax=Pisolithus microcarpus 441 TaxID=765257 RepID=A0A0C9YPF0_9AGAM|nr:hypothetical protein PISMIDRAFT_687050 [Pisolithus microcarpus 441]